MEAVSLVFIKLSVMHYFSSRTQKQQSKIQILILKEKHLKKNFYIPEIIKQCTKELWEEIQLLKHLKIDLRCKQKLGISHVQDHISPIRFRCTVAENRQQSRHGWRPCMGPHKALKSENKCNFG